MKNKNKKTDHTKSIAKVSKKVKDYGNEPYFVSKAEESEVFFKKNGFPKEVVAGGKGKK